jgi:hypothetical protein
MFLAKWSDKGAVENKQNMHFAEKIGQVYRFTIEILQGEIRGRGV